MKSKFIMSFGIYLFIACSGQARPDIELIGKPFPQVSGNSLAGNEITLPDKAAGSITLITVAFLEEGQRYINSWSEPFLERYAGNPEVGYYEVPMMNIPRPEAQKYIDSGMKAGLNADMHPKVVTYYGPLGSYTSALGMSNMRSAYVFLLDKEGIIRYSGDGMMTDENWKELQSVINKLMS